MSSDMYKQYNYENSIETENILLYLLSKYENNREPILVNFRKLINWIPYGERATHFIHPYPGKLLFHIPYLFLSNEVFCKNEGIVFDPFCGSGTVLLESMLNNKNSLGVDVNPLAIMISEVKTTPIDIFEIENQKDKILKNISKINNANKFNSVVNIDYWFYPHVKIKLQNLYDLIEHINDAKIKNFFFICLSSTIKHVSLANPRMSVPVRLKADKYDVNSPLREKIDKRLKRLKRINVYNVFVETVNKNIKRLENFCKLYKYKTTANAIFKDSRVNSEPFHNSELLNNVDLVITSPPYVSAQKYVRATSLNMGWLNLCKSDQMKRYENICIGREHFPKSDIISDFTTGINKADELIKLIRNRNPLRAHISASYLTEMDCSFENIYNLIKPNGYLVLISAKNRVCEYDFETPKYLDEILIKKGFLKRLELVDKITSRALLTKRNGTSGLICREYISVYQKE